MGDPGSYLVIYTIDFFIHFSEIKINLQSIQRAQKSPLILKGMEIMGMG